MEKFLKWLEKYKILFEVSSYSLIGCLGIIISINTCNISNADLRIKKSENQPVIVIESKLADEDSSGFTNQIVKIRNDGGRLKNIHIEKQVVCKVLRNCSRCRGPERSYFDIPVKDYLIGDTLTQRQTGELFEFVRKNNYRDLNNLYDECRLKWSSFNESYSPGILIFVKVQGANLDNEKEVFYFKIDNESFDYRNTIEAVSSDENEWNFHKACTKYSDGKYYISGLTYESINRIYQTNADSIMYKSIRKNLYDD